jgi:hypothetical protein
MNSFGSLSHHQTHKFTIRDIQFMGDKHQFIFLLGTLGCGLFDLLTGSGGFLHYPLYTTYMRHVADFSIVFGT